MSYRYRIEIETATLTHPYQLAELAGRSATI